MRAVKGVADRAEMVVDGLMTIQEVMAFLSVGRTTVYALMDEGLLPYFKAGKIRRLPRRAVIEFVGRHVQGGWAAGA